MHVNSGHASARQLKRVLAAPDGGNSHSPNSFLEHCATCRASDKVPNVLVVATSTAPMFNGKVQVGLLFLDGYVSQVLITHPSTAQETSRGLGMFGRPKSIHEDEGGGWKNEICVQSDELDCSFIE